MSLHISADPQGLLAFAGLILMAFGAWQFGQFLGEPVWSVGSVIELALPFVVGAIAIKVNT
ncbi:MAG: hypothetical protein WC483_02955 [Candidatus Paceibacterota bacterium]|jgi:hypothetical protein